MAKRYYSAGYSHRNTVNRRRKRRNAMIFRGITVCVAALVVIVALALVFKNTLFDNSSTVSSKMEPPVSLVISSDEASSAYESSSQQSEGETSASSSEISASSESSASQSEKPEVSSASESSSTSKPKPLEGDKYPELYVENPTDIPLAEGDKVVYLTFDDGPCRDTIPLLDMLDQYDIKATFFVQGIETSYAPEALQEIVHRGHALEIHTYTHKFQEVYQSVDAYLADFKAQRDYIYNATGVEPTLFRFPGGSINSYNKQTIGDIIDEIERRGYTYFDWNVDSGDASGHNVPADTIYNNVIDGIQGYRKAVVLMHNTDAKKTTMEAMPRIIEKLKEMGYRFSALDGTVAPVQFRRPQ